MATAKKFERFKISRGCSETKLDTQNRDLRKKGHLSAEGRGPHAKDIGPPEAAIMLLSYLGSGKAVKSEARFKALQSIVDEGGRTLLDALTQCLEEDVDVVQVRVSRLRKRAAIRWADGSETLFASPKTWKKWQAQKAHGAEIEDPVEGRLEVEGVLNGAFIRDARAFLRGESTLPASELEEAEDGE